MASSGAGAYTGASLTLTTLGRADLLKTKLFALCDRGTDLADCIAMAPTLKEIEDAEPWLAEPDANLMWPNHCPCHARRPSRKARPWRLVEDLRWENVPPTMD